MACGVSPLSTVVVRGSGDDPWSLHGISLFPSQGKKRRLMNLPLPECDRQTSGSQEGAYLKVNPNRVIKYLLVLLFQNYKLAYCKLIHFKSSPCVLYAIALTNISASLLSQSPTLSLSLWCAFIIIPIWFDQLSPCKLKLPMEESFS